MKRTSWIVLLVVAGCATSKRAPAQAGPPVLEAEKAEEAPRAVDIGHRSGLMPHPEEDVDLLIIERGATDPSHAGPGGGELRAVIEEGIKEVPLPLKHTDVKARVTLHVASVRVRQEYQNPYAGKIEAVYVFPLPQNAAVTDFLMTIGDRTIRGVIREREEARRIYEAAKGRGHTASLLSQERANVFTQRVANIEPGKGIDVEIEYFHTLRLVDGDYEFHFPMVVGPRFHPSGATPGVDTPYLKPDEISAHRVALELDLEPGFPVTKPVSPSHPLRVTGGADRWTATLQGEGTIPNRDFVLRWRPADGAAPAAFAVHREGGGGTFALLLHPPPADAVPPRRAREMVFVVDCSGSMEGEPLAACKRAMRRCLDRLDGNDTFQVIRFSDSASRLGSAPVRATPANVRKGRRYVDGLRANGGTMMIRGIRAALDRPADSERYRIVTFMTDGFIGNEAEILGEVHRTVGAARIFGFGVGNSVNRYLLERMARLGRGVSAYVSTDESGARAVDGLFRRLERPALSDVEIDWGSLQVRDVYPAPLPDLFPGRPVVVTGRFRGDGAPTIRIRGRRGDRREEFTLRADGRTRFDALGKLWARARIATLSDRMSYSDDAGLATAIRDTALEHGLVSAFTSFLAVDSMTVTEGGHGTTVPVPVPVPEGTRYETTVK